MNKMRLKCCLTHFKTNVMCLAIAAYLLSAWSTAAWGAENAAPQADRQKSNHVTGQVMDSKKDPLIGVTVKIVGAEDASATVTDVDGMFSLPISDKTAVLEFTYIGFKKKEVKVTANTLVNVVLDEDTGELDEVIVTGYGSQKKASIIGAIETIKPEQLKFGNTRTLSNNLAGKLSGIIGV